MKISVLCVTKRPEFGAWVEWNYSKQRTHVDRELVVVQGPPEGGTLAPDRARALELASGSHVAWFDDDDWQHPDRLALSLALARSAPSTRAIVGSRRAFYFDVKRARCEPYAGRGLIFNSLLVPVELARDVPRHFEGSKWLAELERRHGRHFVHWGEDERRDPLLFFYLVHGRNVTNARATCRHGAPVLEPLVPDWEETRRRIAALEL